MSKEMKVYCENTQEYVDIRGGETLQEIALGLGDRLAVRPVCARVNNKIEPLQFQVFNPKQVEFLDAHSTPAGRRTYTRSLCMMLFRALQEVYPDWRLIVEHSLAGGLYCRIVSLDGTPMAPEGVAEALGRLEAVMRRLQQADLPFERKERLTRDVIKKFRAEHLNNKSLLLETVRDLYTVCYRLDGTVDSYYGPLAPSTGMLDVFALHPYREGFLLMSPDTKNPDVPAQRVTQDKMFEAFTEYVRFNTVLGVHNVGQMNRAVDDGRATDLIMVAEALHDKKISDIADAIAERYRRGGARIVLVAGPSSSGKTTTTKRLAIYLMTHLLRPQMISLDNYFVNREDTPRDASGDYDYESLHALDLEAFNRDLQALLRGEEVSMPTYNFQLGTREYRGDTLRLEDNTVLLIEGIHGLNPELTASIEERMKYRVYVSALTTLSIDDHNWIPTTDTRLLRRIIRDYKYRGASALDTLRRWPSVRRGEERWIFPYQENADSTFNSSLIFELAVMKDYGEGILRQVPSDVPQYAEAHRLRRFLGYFRPIGEQMVPPTSLLREFLGGSSFHY